MTNDDLEREQPIETQIAEIFMERESCPKTRIDAIIGAVREHTAKAELRADARARVDEIRWRGRAKKAEDRVERVRALASDDADLRSGVVGMVRVSDIRRALNGTEATG